MKSIDTLCARYPQKRAFITGGAGGLGFALAKPLAAAGWRIGLNDLNTAELKSVAAALEKLGGKITTYAFDAGDRNAFEAAANDFLTQYKGVDLVVNNAGVGAAGAFGEFSLDLWQKVIDVNFKGVLHGCHFFINALRKQNAGHIVNISSAAAFASGPRMAAYNATKAAVTALSETLYGELVGTNVKTTVVMPTFFQTNVGKNAIGMAEEKRMAEKLVETSKYTADQIAASIFEAVARNRFYLVLPAQARIIWKIKRYFPTFFLSLVPKVFERRRKKIGL